MAALQMLAIVQLSLCFAPCPALSAQIRLHFRFDRYSPLALEILQSELRRTMQMTGCNSLSEINTDLLERS